MCGLAGIIWKSAQQDRGATERHLAAFEPGLVHRGPDERGVHVGNGFGVVHRRLSIIDIATGQQPMMAEGGTVGIAYNGEIYNHQSLRKELETRGHHFETHCDTEVVLRLFIEQGPDSFNRLDGMFALVIWDLRGATPVYHLARDHLGTKPMYIYEDDKRICFSSEIRPLLAIPDADLSIDPSGLQSFLTFRYTQAPHTLYRRIARLEAGARIRIERGLAVRHRYWDIPSRDRPLDIAAPEARARLHDLLKQSVSDQQMSEVPVGLLLSGGLDSSVIAYLCGELGVRLKSFNIGFPSINEFTYSSEVAKAFSLDHLNVETTVEAIIDRFETAIEAMDEPIADPACFPLHILCDEISRHVTVVLSGEGSDEMLGGYPQYRQVFDNGPLPSAEQFDRFLRQSWYFLDKPPVLSQPFDAARRLRHASYFLERPPLEGMLAYDLKTWLPENLMMKADKILMSHSLEGRFPFLSKAIAEFLMALPDDMKLGVEGGKRLLREAFGKRLPQRIIDRPKMGFSVPLDELVAAQRDRGYDLLNQHASSELAACLDIAEVRRRFDAHHSGETKNSLWAWTTLALLQWMSAAGRAGAKTPTLPAAAA
ncbi:MAG: asparagine synthase (glutamine-hydrolyzing) [Hyphomicrobiaceae bacterium]